MAIRVPRIMHAKQILGRSKLFANQVASNSTNVPKGYIAVYVGESQKKRFIVPISFLNWSSFQKLLSIAEEEFGFNHPMGGTACEDIGGEVWSIRYKACCNAGHIMRLCPYHVYCTMLPQWQLMKSKFVEMAF
ncbi:hypothetical protein Goshw_018911 [Gossypium schwendimanii]|uniref:Uncharacterized protein n=1 Tax=Gossypium schwendimanii TaxID=34291 RepID=A0A7J9KM20_GOSSC|nr:hypothetical protein [Gossypium schwendimanii]